MVVFSGQGQGQYRRIVSWPDNSGTSWNWTHGTFEIDRPLDAPLGPDSVVQVMPYRGQMIFHRNHFKDTGAFNFYGISIDNIVAENTAERFQGYQVWGQWRPNGGPPANKSGAYSFWSECVVYCVLHKRCTPVVGNTLCLLCVADVRMVCV